MSVLDEIAAERRRQIEVEGWSTEHDDAHEDGVLATAAANYAEHAGASFAYEGNLEAYRSEHAPIDWPWDDKWWRPKDPRNDLVRAAALIVAEIERIDRTAVSSLAHGKTTSEQGGAPG